MHPLKWTAHQACTLSSVEWLTVGSERPLHYPPATEAEQKSIATRVQIKGRNSDNRDDVRTSLSMAASLRPIACVQYLPPARACMLCMHRDVRPMIESYRMARRFKKKCSFVKTRAKHGCTVVQSDEDVRPARSHVPRSPALHWIHLAGSTEAISSLADRWALLAWLS